MSLVYIRLGPDKYEISGGVISNATSFGGLLVQVPSNIAVLTFIFTVRLLCVMTASFEWLLISAELFLASKLVSSVDKEELDQVLLQICSSSEFMLSIAWSYSVFYGC